MSIFGANAKNNSINQDNRKSSFFFNKMEDAFSYQKVILDEYNNPKDSIIIQANNEFIEFLGSKEEKVIGKKLLEIAPNTNKNLFEAIGEVALTGIAIKYEMFNEPLGKWYEIKVFSYEKYFFVILANDISKQKILTEGIRKANNNLEAIIIEKTYLLKELNSQLEEMNIRLVKEIHDRYKAEEQVKKLNNNLEAKVLDRTSKLRDEIKERKLTEEALIAAMAKASMASEAKNKFLANISHEIRTPMNGIIGMMELLLMTNIDDEQKEYIDIVKNSTKALLKVLNDVLDYSKSESLGMKLEYIAFDIYSDINDVINMFSICAKEKGLYISKYINDLIPKVLIGDSVKFKQALSNILGNAIKFTITGGVSIKVDIVEFKENEINLKFIIKDTGIGVPKDKINNLFNSFTQIEDSYTRDFGGAGLGLVISKNIIESMNGKITVESTEGIGSVFSFTAVFQVGDENSISLEDESYIISKPS